MFNKGLIAASIKPLILSILTPGSSYGYEIIQRVKEISGGHLEWAEGTLYPVLHKLEHEKLISSKWIISPDGRKRKYYSLTVSGKKELVTEKEAWLRVHNTLMHLWELPPTKAVS